MNIKGMPFIILPAVIAERNLKAMVRRKGNIVRSAATMSRGERRIDMSDDLRTRLTRYRMAMGLALEMLRQGLITEDEYGIIDTIMTKRYGLTSSTIFR